jgi:protein-S-isoprenylcysteine O-methyltransferase Ste14
MGQEQADAPMNPILHEWQWVELWPYAILMIVFASWLLYLFFAPRSWREWAGAGLVQAFIIALYGEMYGFPLTIYVLTGLLHVKIPMVHNSGHLWATLLGYGEDGDAVEMAIASLFIVTGIVLILRGWIRIYFSDGQLVSDGVYAVIRHPQYAGIFLAVLGQLVHWPTILTVLLAPLIVGAYIRLARREEAQLIGKYGADYLEYRRRVPMFLPRLRDAAQVTARAR